MDANLLVIGCLLFVIIFQYLTIQKLVDKIMSRSFHEYKTAETYDAKPTVKINDTEIPEDLRSLSEFSLG